MTLHEAFNELISHPLWYKAAGITRMRAHDVTAANRTGTLGDATRRTILLQCGWREDWDNENN